MQNYIFSLETTVYIQIENRKFYENLNIYIYIFSIDTLYQKRKYYIILQEKNKILKKDIT